MEEKIISTIITFVVSSVLSGVLGYMTNTIKNYRKRDNTQEEALKCLLRSNITSKYYVYTEIGAIPLYEKENIDYMHEQYKNMGGNSYIDQIVKEINKLPIAKSAKKN